MTILSGILFSFIKTSHTSQKRVYLVLNGSIFCCVLFGLKLQVYNADDFPSPCKNSTISLIIPRGGQNSKIIYIFVEYRLLDFEFIVTVDLFLTLKNWWVKYIRYVFE